MAFQGRRIDRAQRSRARRIWWERHGAFAKGAVTGTVVTALVFWAVLAATHG